MCSCNLRSVLEQGAICKGMSGLTTNDAWPGQARVVVGGKGMDCNIDSLDCKVSSTSMVIFVNLNGMKAIAEGSKCQGRC